MGSFAALEPGRVAALPDLVQGHHLAIGVHALPEAVVLEGGELSARGERRQHVGLQHHARIVWEGTKEDLRAHRIEVAEQTLPASSMPERGGDASRADPSRAACAVNVSSA